MFLEFQNFEPNKLLFFINYLAYSFLLQLQKMDQRLPFHVSQILSLDNWFLQILFKGFSQCVNHLKAETGSNN